MCHVAFRAYSSRLTTSRSETFVQKLVANCVCVYCCAVSNCCSSAQISQKAEGKTNYWRHTLAQFFSVCCYILRYCSVTIDAELCYISQLQSMAEESESRVEEIDGSESYASMKSTSAANIVAIWLPKSLKGVPV